MKDILARIAELEALAVKATPGPWDINLLPYPPYLEVIPGKGHTDDDAYLINEARTAVPELCEQVRKLMQENDLFKPHMEALTQGAQRALR